MNRRNKPILGTSGFLHHRPKARKVLPGGFFFSLSLAVCLLLSTSSNGAYEAVSKAVYKYGYAPLLSCPAGNDCFAGAGTDMPCLVMADDFQDTWRQWINSYGYTVNWSYMDTGVLGSHFADSGLFTWGNDDVQYTGIDWPDVMHYFGHGGACCNNLPTTDPTCDPGEYFSYLTMGDLEVSSSRCRMRSAYYFDFLPYYGHMKLGDDDLNFMVLTTCHGGEYCAWEHGGWYLVAGSGSMNMILAFHGTFDGNTDALEDFDTFMSLSEQYHAGQKWVTYMYHPDMAGYDNCPVTMGWGKSYSQIDSYIYHDQAFLNFNNIRPPDYSSYYFKAGCEPGGAITPLPSSSPAHR